MTHIGSVWLRKTTKELGTVTRLTNLCFAAMYFQMQPLTQKFIHLRNQ